MNIDHGVEIDAAAPLVWEVFTDVERWPDWTASVTRLVALDGSGLAVGRRFELTQPKLRTAIWKVTDVAPGHGWTWVQDIPGGSVSARHEVSPIAPDRTMVRQTVATRGALGALVGVLVLRTTRRYLDMEGRGLKERSEQLQRSRGPRS